MSDKLISDMALQQLNATAAARHNVAAEVHAADLIYDFIITNPVFPTQESAVNYYFDDGARSASKIANAVDRHFGPGRNGLKVLEFASGYGAVARHMPNVLPEHEHVACDIHPDAIAFLSERLGVQGLQSSHSPEDFPGQKSDLIFVLSFFSHMPKATWSKWLSKLYDGLLPGGVLLFTTHGMISRQYFPQCSLDTEGFWFEAQSEQHDLDSAEYGMTVTSKPFVDKQLASLNVEYLLYEQAGWWDHQDLYIVRKPKAES